MKYFWLYNFQCFIIGVYIVFLLLFGCTKIFGIHRCLLLAKFHKVVQHLKMNSCRGCTNLFQLFGWNNTAIIYFSKLINSMRKKSFYKRTHSEPGRGTRCGWGPRRGPIPQRGPSSGERPKNFVQPGKKNVVQPDEFWVKVCTHGVGWFTFTSHW